MNAKELLEKLEAEFNAALKEEIAKNEEGIKEVAQKAYDDAVLAEYGKIKEEVNKRYIVARDYLTKLIDEEKPVEEQVEASIEEAPAEEVQTEGDE